MTLTPTPTPKLRFVVRYEPTPTPTPILVLQQWWEKKIWAHDDWVVDDGEWRDVPIEENT